MLIKFDVFSFSDEDTKDRGKLYKPQSRIELHSDKSTAEKAQEYARSLDRKQDRSGKKKEKEKKKSNLELFKEELRM